METTAGGFFNRQHRQSFRVEWQEVFQLLSHRFYGTHDLKAGLSFAYSSYDAYQHFEPVNIVGVAGFPLERIDFSSASTFSVDQNEAAWFVGDKWTISNHLAFDLGLRFDRDTTSDSMNTAPRAGFVFTLPGDGKTELKAGPGCFTTAYRSTSLHFLIYPRRAVLQLNPVGQIQQSTTYLNQITTSLRDPRSQAVEPRTRPSSHRQLRQVTAYLLVRASYQQRNRAHEFVLTPTVSGEIGVLSLLNSGRQFYREFQVTGRYRIGRGTLSASYTRSRAYGDLNDFNHFFGNDPQVAIQPNQRARLPFDAPNRFLVWGEFGAPGS